MDGSKKTTFFSPRSNSKNSPKSTSWHSPKNLITDKKSTKHKNHNDQQLQDKGNSIFRNSGQLKSEFSQRKSSVVSRPYTYLFEVDSNQNEKPAFIENQFSEENESPIFESISFEKPRRNKIQNGY